MIHHCRHCGETLADEDTYCKGCERDLKRPVYAEAKKPSFNLEPIRKGILICLCLLLVYFIWVSLVGFNPINIFYGSDPWTLRQVHLDGSPAQPKQEKAPEGIIKVYIYPLPEDVNPKYKDAAREGLSYWEKRENRAFNEIPSPDGADLLINWQKEIQGEEIGIWSGKYVLLGLGSSHCEGGYKYHSYDVVADTAKHEIGHYLGYQHSNIPDSIMYPRMTIACPD